MKKDNLISLVETAYGSSKKKQKSSESTADIDTSSASKYFVPLGYDGKYLFFVSVRGQHVVRFTHQQMTHKACLFILAPLAWWERTYMCDEGFKGDRIDQAASWLIESCYNKGIFSPGTMRGRGAWWDDGRGIVHTGSYLLVDGVKKSFTEVETEYVYEAQAALKTYDVEPATDEEAIKLVQLCTLLNWENQLYGLLCAGWVVSALVGGALPWRPHAITTGPSGCGKSWVADNVFYTILGDYMVAAKGSETTEAGLRHALRHDSLSVIFDEAEVEDGRAQKSFDRVLGLMRTASAEGAGRILKGGQDGVGMSYTIRSCFQLLSIRVPLQQTADLNRVTVLTLRKSTPESKAIYKQQIKPLAAEIGAGDWAARLRARIFANIGTLRHNTEMFSEALSRVFNARIGDQYGPMLGGTWLLGTTVPITTEDAEEKIKSMDFMFDDVRDISSESDEEKLVASLFVQQLRVPGDKRTVERSIAELINIALEVVKDEIWPEDAHGALQRHGMRIDGETIRVANRHEGMKALLEKTPWGVGWSHILRRIDGAKASQNNTTFAGTPSRYVTVPLKEFISK